MPEHLYAETLLVPGLSVSFQWRYQNTGGDLLSIIDPASPVYRALKQSIERFENTVFDLAANKPTLVEWANSQETLQDTADRRELRLGGAHVFQQSIELLQGMQMMSDRTDDPDRLSAIHHNIGDVMGLIGQRSGSQHFLEQAALSYEQALEIRTKETMPLQWAQSTCNLGLVMQAAGLLEDDSAMLKHALQTLQQSATLLPRDTGPTDWSAVMNSIGTVLYQLGIGRRGSRTLEQALVAFRNAISERHQDKQTHAWIITQNNLAATMQGLGEHEEDIGSLEASIPVYDTVLKVLEDKDLPLVTAVISANRSSAMLALASESDYLDMAEAAVTEFEKLATLFGETDYTHYLQATQQRVDQAKDLVASLQV